MLAVQNCTVRWNMFVNIYFTSHCNWRSYVPLVSLTYHWNNWVYNHNLVEHHYDFITDLTVLNILQMTLSALFIYLYTDCQYYCTWKFSDVIPNYFSLYWACMSIWWHGRVDLGDARGYANHGPPCGVPVGG